MSQLPTVATYRSCSSLCRWLTALFVIAVIFEFMGIGAESLRLTLIGKMESRSAVSQTEKDDNDYNLQLVGYGHFAVYVPGLVLFFVWVCRAHRNLTAISAEGIRFSPGWAVGWFFIPLANLVIPAIVLHHVWKKSDAFPLPPDMPFYARSRIIRRVCLWWAFWLADAVLARLVHIGLQYATTLAALAFFAAWSLVSHIIGCVSLILTIRMVRAITRDQDHRAEHLRLFVRPLTSTPSKLSPAPAPSVLPEGAAPAEND